VLPCSNIQQAAGRPGLRNRRRGVNAADGTALQRAAPPASARIPARQPHLGGPAAPTWRPYAHRRRLQRRGSWAGRAVVDRGPATAGVADAGPDSPLPTVSSSFTAHGGNGAAPASGGGPMLASAATFAVISGACRARGYKWDWAVFGVLSVLVYLYVVCATCAVRGTVRLNSIQQLRMLGRWRARRRQQQRWYW